MRTITTIGAILLTSGLLFIHPLSLVRSDEPHAGTARGTPEPASPDTTPMIGDNPFSQSEAGDIQERGVLPGLVTPNAILQRPELTVPAPTPSLTAIRNAMNVTSKSVSVNLRIPPNLPVTVPVEVSVAYISPAQTQRLTKTYSPTTGLTLLYREAEGDGKPRAMTLDITVRELVPNGKSFAVSKQFTITPLFDVSISKLMFTMRSFCDTVGKNDITFVWSSPDGRMREIKFDAATHEGKVISQFSWGRRVISAQTNLVEPSMQFFERDLGAEFHPPFVRSINPLVPGPTKQIFDFVLNEHASGPRGQPFPLSADCQARIQYRIDRRLMTFDQF